MAIVMVPVMAAFEKDLTTNLRLLEEIVQPAGHEIGLEVIGKPSHFFEPEQRARMIENLKKYAAGLRIVSHQWSGNIVYDTSPSNLAFSELRTRRGRKAIECGISFAEEAIAAGIIPEGQKVYVHTHGDINPQNSSEDRLEYHRHMVIKSLTEMSKKHPGVVIGLENLPVYPNSDDPELLKTPEKVGVCDFECLEDYMMEIIGTDLRLTFDTAHYAYDFKPDFKIDLVEAVDVFGEYLRHIHVNDARGYWIPGKSVNSDGYVPGEGKIGREEFERFFRHLKDRYDLSTVSVEAEIQDTDYSNPQNRKEALRRISEWLS